MKQVGVFLSSSMDVAPTFRAEAEVLGEALARSGFGVVYGGSCAGCMGHLAQGVIRGRGHLIGVVPEMDFLEGLVQDGLSEKVVVRDLSGRKGKMIELSEAFIGYPGGLGTLDEILDVLALRQIGQHQKPMIFYNYLGFWSAFLECLETYHQQRMIASALDDLFVVLERPLDVVNYLQTCFRN